MAGITGDRSEVLAVVRHLLDEGTDAEANLAVSALGKLGDAAVALVPRLAVRLASGERNLRLCILPVLEGLGAAAEPALPAIEALLESDDPILSKLASKASAAIREREQDDDD